MITILVVFVLAQAVKKTKVDNKWLPWISMGIGMVAGVISVAVTKDTNWLPGGLMGLLVGGFTSGLFDGFKGFNVKGDKK